MLQISWSVSLLVLLFGSLTKGADPPRVKLGNDVTLEGKEIQTVGNLGKTPKTYYTFRNIPYANPITQTNRFSVIFLVSIDLKSIFGSQFQFY